MEKNKQIQACKCVSQGILDPKGLDPYPFFKRFMALPQAAYYTGQAESSIKRAVYDGELPVIQRGERSKWILDAYDLDAWMLTAKRYHKPVDERMRDRGGRFK